MAEQTNIGLYDFDWLRQQADDSETLELVNQLIAAEERHRHEGLRQQGDDLLELHLGGKTIYTRGVTGHSIVHIYPQIFKFREQEVPKEFRHSMQVIVDIGANEGYWTLALKRDNPATRIIALEPNPLAYELLERNIAANRLSDVTLLPFAAGKQSGSANFQIIKQVTSIGAFSLMRTGRPWLTEDMLTNLKVDVTTLDELWQTQHLGVVDLVKIDTEGGELDILQGAGSVLGKIRLLELEYHSAGLREATLALLTAQGFQVIAEQKIRPDNGTLFLKHT